MKVVKKLCPQITINIKSGLTDVSLKND